MKKVLFLTGTRADFGKLKPLIQILEKNNDFEYHILATGMHLQEQYGYTYIEIEKCGFKNITAFKNHTASSAMDLTLAKSIEGISAAVIDLMPDMIVIHGDRVETLAGAIVGSLNNILVAHVEGGELSGTVDELIRHSVSKLSHIHFVANEEAEKRLIQMGELASSIYVIGSPDIDIMFSDTLPDLATVKQYYEINFQTYAVAMFHPVTTEVNHIAEYTENFINAILKSNRNYVIIYPNNDLGSNEVMVQIKKLKSNDRFRIIPSLRFEYFLSLLKEAEFMIGNSSAGVREAPYYKVPSINIGSRQNNRSKDSQIINCGYAENEILDAISKIGTLTFPSENTNFGNGKSSEGFLRTLKSTEVWRTEHQKQFRDLS
ncbi:UDP-N-acetylglucosamine 2-epimerase (hydrolysing) [Gramella sp. Hel_I_59]|uniref:UDP-N-acetylglucosamine 2-epimerase n=1 Tax=Gramella sp. Hel_I_59 TaxID=1249978 RepID=UPI001152A373|nr:UDP-N-acetylglucosamine 2-epimerase [Gramella sp. Hel_I_59]TQI71527.1 UDP-N-acetylglucosamine 2-epimerase (hydrolysing) [Gramella sp. Hel_I_59]